MPSTLSRCVIARTTLCTVSSPGRTAARSCALLRSHPSAQSRLDLEASWRAADHEKKSRERDYEDFRKAPAPMTILEQTDDYVRCLRYARACVWYICILVGMCGVRRIALACRVLVSRIFS